MGLAPRIRCCYRFAMLFLAASDDKLFFPHDFRFSKSPITLVNPLNKEALKEYEDLRKDPNVIYNSSGFIRLEHPIGESREDYYRRTERESTQRNLADEQRHQLEQSVQQFGKDMNKQLDDWNKKLQEMFQQKK